jgi:hypothetical protein
MMKETKIDGQTVKVGDWVGFKCDIEQGGQIKSMKRTAYSGVELTLENKNGFSGEYIGGETLTVERASDCWID